MDTKLVFLFSMLIILMFFKAISARAPSCCPRDPYCCPDEMTRHPLAPPTYN
ncbi:hypothetical protein IHE45_03G072200 [Dioscorea alata]|uniref:Uncharacterized protein n=1 Tax=Dioscorea alata TaxID=55571 RepID=A0ACB7WLI0_DIOAL|nr:hypothetical protein IHE45_03G072200 [Dioscorea alata]